MVDILRPDYGQAWASEGEKVAPTADKAALGWVQEMMPFQWENFLQARQDEALLYLLQKGVPEYSPTQEYTANKSVVQYQGNLYLATAAVTGVLPTVTASWRRLSPTLASNGTVSVAGGGTGATNAAQARANLGLGDASTATLPTATGVVVKGAGETLISRLLTGTSGDIVITNPDGVAGNINIGVGSNVAKTNQDSSWTSKGGITLPKGSSSERGVEVPGKIRYNTELQKFEGYNGTSWNALGAASEVEITTLSGGGITTSFTLNTPAFSESSTDVYIGGVYQNKGTYSVSGTTLTFYEAPTPGTDNIQVVSRRVVDLGIARASQVSIEDAANKYTATTVEGALREITEYEGEIGVKPSWDDVPKHKSDVFNAQAQALANRTEMLTYGIGAYNKIREYVGAGTRLKVQDPTGVHWWVRRGSKNDNGCTVLKDSLNRSWEREYSGAVNAAWTGTDQVAVQYALDAASGGAIIFDKGFTFTWSGNGPTVRSNTKVIGLGGVIVQPLYDNSSTIRSGDEFCGLRWDCGAEDIEITGLDIRGPFYESANPTPSYRSIGIAGSGRYDQYFYNNPNYPASPSLPVSGTSKRIKLIGNKIRGFGQSGVIADQIDFFTAKDNHISKCTRDGIRMYGVKWFDVSDNFIQDLAPGFPSEGIAPNNNVYGVSATRIYHSTAGDGDTEDYRPTCYGSVTRNNVRNCPSWKALDTHGGHDISFNDNVIYNAHIGVGIDKGGFNASDGYAPPRRITVANNIITADLGNPAENRAGVFAVAHDSTSENIGEDLIISGNYIFGYGQQSRDGGIVVSNFNRVNINGGIVDKALRTAVNFQGFVDNAKVSGIVISNVRKSDFGMCAGVNPQGTQQRISVSDITFTQSLSDEMTSLVTGAPAAGFGVTLADDCSYIGNASRPKNPAHLTADSSYLFQTIAIGNINLNESGAALIAGRGIKSVTRTSIGVVNIELDRQIYVPTAVFPSIDLKSNNVRAYCSSITGGVTVNVRNISDGASVDAGFFIKVSGY